MKKRILLVVITPVFLLLVVGVSVLWGRTPERFACPTDTKTCPDGSAVGRVGSSCEFAPCLSAKIPSIDVEPGGGGSDPDDDRGLPVPIDRAPERVTKKPFGVLIDPRTSPVQPERFSGYHTGTDFETFPEERDADVTVRAVCDGTIVAKRRADGYGGIVVERCDIGGEESMVVYGHLAVSSVDPDIGDAVRRGDVIGLLGAAGSADTDLERKHLHLGIRRGADADIRGYVSDRAALSGWVDPCDFFCGTR